MKTLFIDTHFRDVVIALLEDGEVLKEEKVADNRNTSELLFPSLIKVIDKETIDEILVVNGPGSFTGVRLGVIIAKTLAYTKNIPIKSITSLECMAASSGKRKVAFSDNNGYYVGIFDEKLKIKELKYLSNAEFQVESDYETSCDLDYKKIWKYCKDKACENPHLVNPIYIKKIGVEKNA